MQVTTKFSLGQMVHFPVHAEISQLRNTSSADYSISSVEILALFQVTAIELVKGAPQYSLTAIGTDATIKGVPEKDVQDAQNTYPIPPSGRL